MERAFAGVHSAMRRGAGALSVKHSSGLEFSQLLYDICSLPPVLYFDHNATSPLCEAAREAWLEASARYIGNPSSPHRLGSRADRVLQEAREELAAMLGCRAHEILWTAGATEANNTVIRHFASNSGEVWVSGIEHPCVLEPARRYFQGRLLEVPVQSDGVIELQWLQERLKRSRPVVVAIMAANNETGVLQPWKEASMLCQEAGVPLLCDAAQWVGKLPAKGMGECGLLTACAHKFGGPQGVGFIRTETPLQPLLFGGPQEDGQRAGTENVAGILAMVAALRAREAMLAQEQEKERREMRDTFAARLVDELPGTKIIGNAAPRLWNTVTAIMPEIDCRQRWVVKLDKLGVAASTGSACASGKEKPSHVLSAMGIPPEKAARALRFTSGWETKPEAWERLLEILQQAAVELR